MSDNTAWEYETVDVPWELIVDELNHLGIDGWEVVGMFGGNGTTSVLLKRRIRNPNQEVNGDS